MATAKAQQITSKNFRDPSNIKSNTRQSTLWASLTTAVILLSSLSVALLALRNTVTLHLQNFWGTSGDFWQQQWDRSVAAAGGDMFLLLMAGVTGVSYVVYWSFGLLFAFLDITQMPHFFRRYKVQPGTNEPVDIWKLLKVVGVVHFNQLIMSPIAGFLVYRLMQLRGYDTSPSLPTFHWVLFELAIFVLGEEVGFYYAHRILHHRLLYKHFHKLHHEWQSPVAIVVLYSHPVEFMFSIVLPGLIGPLITGCHMSTYILWTQVQIIFSIHQHSGYHLPFMPSPEAHDYHHLKFTECFGVLGVLDLLHGTDNTFRSSEHYSRDFVSFTTTPVREAFPDIDHDKTSNKPKLTSAQQ